LWPPIVEFLLRIKFYIVPSALMFTIQLQLGTVEQAATMYKDEIIWKSIIFKEVGSKNDICEVKLKYKKNVSYNSSKLRQGI
jgi:hypothetical protein